MIKINNLTLGNSIIETMTNMYLGMSHREPLVATMNGTTVIMFQEGYRGITINTSRVAPCPNTYKVFYMHNNEVDTITAMRNIQIGEGWRNYQGKVDELLRWARHNTHTHECTDGFHEFDYINIDELTDKINELFPINP